MDVWVDWGTDGWMEAWMHGCKVKWLTCIPVYISLLDHTYPILYQICSTIGGEEDGDNIPECVLLEEELTGLPNAWTHSSKEEVKGAFWETVLGFNHGTAIGYL